MLDRKTTLFAVLLVSSALTACGKAQDEGWNAVSPARYCVDQHGRRVEDRDCAQNAGHAYGSPFLWYYLGTLYGRQNYYVPPLGGGATGGGFTPVPGLSYAAAPTTAGASRPGFSTVSRGGFGGTSESLGVGGAGE